MISNLKRTISIALLGFAIIGILTACSQKASPTTETTPVTFTLPELFLIPPDNTKAVISVNYNEVKPAFQAANPDAARALAEKIDSFLATIPDSTEDDPITIIVFGMNNGENNASFVLVTHDKQIYMAGSTNQQGESTAIGAPLYAGNTVNGIGIFYNIGNERVALLEETGNGINVYTDHGMAVFNPGSTLNSIDESGKLTSLVPIGNDKTPEYYKNLEGKWIEVQGDFVQDGESILVWTGTEFISTSVPEGFKPNHIEQENDNWLLFADDGSSLIWDGTNWVKAKTTYDRASWKALAVEQKADLVAALPATSPEGNTKAAVSKIDDTHVYYLNSDGRPTEIYDFSTGEFAPAYETVQIKLTDGSLYEMPHFDDLPSAIEFGSMVSQWFLGADQVTEAQRWYVKGGGAEVEKIVQVVKMLPGRDSKGTHPLPASGPDFFYMKLYATDSGYKMLLKHPDGSFELVDVTIRTQGDIDDSLYSGSYDYAVTIPPLPSSP